VIDHFLRRAATLAVLAVCAAIGLPAKADPAPDGKALFQERCSGCHTDKIGRAPAVFYLATRLPSEIFYTLTKGEMREQAAGLTGDQLKSIASFLTGRPMEPEPDSSVNRCTAPGTINLGPKQWPSWGHDIHNTRFQADPGFTAADLPRLKVKWAFALPGLTGSPTVAGDYLFVSSRMGKVFALNSRTGCTYWAYDAGTPVRNAVAVGSLGDARHGAFFGDQNGIVHGLDAATGKELWQVRADDYEGARIVGSVTYHDGVVYAPVTSGDEVAALDPTKPCCTFRGSVVALDAATGRQIWKGYTIQEAPKPTRVNSEGTQMFGPAGAGVWSAPTIDAKRGIVFAATGDAYVNPASDASDAIVAFDLKTGKRLWTSQVLKNDAWLYSCAGAPVGNCPSPMGPDYDFSSPPLLQTMADGKDVIVSGSKSATVYGFDPDQKGKVLWGTVIGRGSSSNPIWGVTADGTHAYAGTPFAALKPGTTGGFNGVDLATGKAAWHTESPDSACAWGATGCLHTQTGAATLIPGAVFAGSMDGHLRAYDTATGNILWDFDAGREWPAVNAPKAFGGNLDGAPQTVANGTLYVNAGNAALSSTRHGDAVLAITVDGK
jgi:polyvinyl alcohol dehydrogenase (cytochrome)